LRPIRIARTKRVSFATVTGGLCFCHIGLIRKSD
jgi:hypothetical protein